MVGTRPIVAPAARHSRASARIASGVLTTTGSGPGSVLDLSNRRLRRVGRILVLWAWERALPHLVGKLLSGARDVVREVRVALHELRRLAGGEAEEVVEHQHLAVGLRPSADADGRDTNGARHPSRQDRRHPFQHQAESPGLLQRLRVGQDAIGLGLALALYLEAAHLVHELRR